MRRKRYSNLRKINQGEVNTQKKQKMEQNAKKIAQIEPETPKRTKVMLITQQILSHWEEREGFYPVLATEKEIRE